MKTKYFHIILYLQSVQIVYIFFEEERNEMFNEHVSICRYSFGDKILSL